MRHWMMVMSFLVLCATLSSAQGKIASEWKCQGPSDQHGIAVPDREGHSYNVSQGKCTSEKGSMGGAKEQEGTYTEFGEMAGNAVQNHGVFVVTLAGGDKVFYHYHGTQIVKEGNLESATNKWTLAGGTGKYKTVKGEGGCTGKGNPDGSSNWKCDGSYSGTK